MYGWPHYPTTSTDATPQADTPTCSYTPCGQPARVKLTHIRPPQTTEYACDRHKAVLLLGGDTVEPLKEKR